MATQNLGRVKIVWQGEYNSATAYVIDDAVTYEGSSYVCIKAAANKVPTNTEYWELIAQKGADGDVTQAQLDATVATLFPRSEQETTGAYNLFDINLPRTNAANVTSPVTSSATGSSLTVANSTAGTYKEADYLGLSFPKNADLKAIFGATVTSGKGRFFIDGSNDGTNWTNITSSDAITTNGNFTVTFNTGNYASYRIRWYCTLDASTTGSVTYTDIMIVYALNTPSAYVPFAKTNKQLTDIIPTLYPRSEQAVLGAKNVFADLSWMQGNGGGSFSYSDGTYTINTTTTDYSGAFFQQDKMRPYFSERFSGAFKLSFKYKGDSSFACLIGESNNRATTISTEFTEYSCVVSDITAINNIIFYTRDTSTTHTITVKDVMLTIATDTDPTYSPHAMTNRELTVNLPVATASTLDDVISIMAQKTICLINSRNNHLIDALTNNDLQDSSCKIIAYNQGSMIDWYGMVGASAFCIGRITNGAYTSHKKATLS